MPLPPGFIVDNVDPEVVPSNGLPQGFVLDGPVQKMNKTREPLKPIQLENPYISTALGQIGDAGQRQWDAAKYAISLPLHAMETLAVAAGNLPTTIANKVRGQEPGMAGYTEPRFGPGAADFRILPQIQEPLPGEMMLPEPQMGPLASGLVPDTNPKPREMELSPLGVSYNEVAKFINSFVSPETGQGLLLPFMGTKLLQSAYKMPILAESPEQVQHGAATAANPNLPMQERVAGGVNAGLNAVVGSLVGGHALKEFHEMRNPTLPKTELPPDAWYNSSVDMTKAPSEVKTDIPIIGQQNLDIGTRVLGKNGLPAGFVLDQPVDIQPANQVKARDVRPPDPNWRVTVQGQQTMPDGQTKVPGYTQVDDMAGGQNKWSSNPAALRDQGYRMPDLADVAPGKYRLGDIAPAEEQSFPPPRPPKAGPQPVESAAERTASPGTSLYTGLGAQLPEGAKDAVKSVAKLALGMKTREEELRGGTYTMNIPRMMLTPGKEGHGFTSSEAVVDGTQLWNRAKNKHAAEASMLEEMGVADQIRGQRLTPAEAAKIVQEQGPRVEVKKFGSEVGLTVEEKENAKLIHKLDTELPNWRSLASNEVPEKLRETYNRQYQLSKEIPARVIQKAHWSDVAPKAEADMPGYVELAVTKPQHIVKGWGGAEAQHESTHNFPPNTLAFARGYMDKVGDKKVFHLIEVQSDWAKHEKDVAETYKKVTGKEDAKKREPLLRHYERLAVKAAIEHAKKEGAEGIVIQDSKSAMLMEGHDQAAMEDFPDMQARVENGRYSAITEDMHDQVRRGYPDIKQQKGMELHYDKTLPQIAEELTGNKGEPVELGEHKMALDDKGTNPDGTPYKAMRKDLFIENPDGSLKTTVSGRYFPLEKTKEAPYSLLDKDKPGTKNEYLYSGLGFKLPEGVKREVGRVIRKLVNDGATMHDMFRNGDTIDKVAGMADAADNLARRQMGRVERAVELRAEELLPGKDNSGNRKQALNAIPFMVEAKNNRMTMQGFKTKVAGDKDATTAVEYAQKNWATMQDLVKTVLAEDRNNMIEAANAGIKYTSIKDAIRDMHNVGERGLFFPDRPTRLLPKSYPTLADAIADKQHPISLNGAALLAKQTSELFEKIETRNWINAFKAIRDDAGNPIIVPLKKGKAPLGYERNDVLNVAVIKSHKNIFNAVTGRSGFEQSKIGRVLLETKGFAKHGMLAIDTFHMFRIMMFRQAYNKYMGLGGLPGYAKGLSIVEYRPADLQRAVDAGLVPKDAVKYAQTVMDLPQGKITHHEAADMLMRDGHLNVGRHSEALYTSAVRRIPILGGINRFIFDRLTRGAMIEGGIIGMERIAKQHPGWSLEKVAREVSKDVNFRMGNLGRQGLFKSRNAQAAMQLTMLAPQWVESMARSEGRSLYQLGKALVPGSENFLKLGTMARGSGTLLGAFVVATQVLNALTTGHGTWGNEEGHKLDAWVPPVTKEGKGFWISPLSVVAELTHDYLRYKNTDLDNREVFSRIMGNKMSSLANAVTMMKTGEDWKGDPMENQWEVVKNAAITAVNPTPLFMRQAAESIKKGELASGQRQLAAMGGIKAEPETERERQSRVTKDLSLVKRGEYTMSKDKEKEYKTVTEVAASGIKAQEHELKRRKALIESLAPETQKWLRAQELNAPGYDTRLKYGKYDLPLSKEETKQYADRIRVEYESMVKSLRQNPKFLESSMDNRHEWFNKAMLAAKKKATASMIKSLEKDHPPK